ncbi:MAG: helical backbone metal receptor [Actinomycetes bacterium]
MTGPPRRVVCLVPSLTEAIATSAPGVLVGATDWCTRPGGLRVTRVGGTKNPSVPVIRALAPDLVVANAEENRAEDLGRLRDAGLVVWVTDVRTVPGALASLGRLLDGCGVPRPGWLDEAQTAWRPPWSGPALRAVVPIWRRPWMVLGQDTFAGDVLARVGVVNVFADHPQRYPRITLEEIRSRSPQLVVLPDEPYAFGATDGPEAFAGLPVALVDGRDLTWYGPSLATARSALATALAEARASALARAPGPRGPSTSVTTARATDW